MPGFNKHHAGLLVSVLLFLALGYWLVKPDAVNYKPYLSFSPDVDGVKAWRELLESRQPAVKEWRLDWKHLPASSGAQLIVVEPAGVTEADREHVLDWVARGNDLLLFAAQPLDWESLRTVLAEEEADASDGSTAERAIAAQADYQQGAFSGTVSTRLRISPGPEQQTLFSDSLGVLASRAQHGKGSMTLVLTPDWLRNDTIMKHSHFELLWPLFDGGQTAVWIDESHHGYGAKPGLLAVYPPWLVLVSAQLGLALALWLWLRGKRFGPVHLLRAWTVRRGDETLLAVAAWYERLGFRREALAHQQQLLRQLLAQRWGLSPGASPQQAAEAARARWPEAQASRLERLLQETPGDAGAKAFVERTRDVGEMIAYLEKE